jgi:hypothetical protein
MAKIPELFLVNMQHEDFEIMLSDIVKKTVNEALKEISSARKAEYIKKSEACKILGITPRRLTQLIEQGTFPCYTIDGTDRLIRSEIENAMMPVKNLQHKRICR